MAFFLMRFMTLYPEIYIISKIKKKNNLFLTVALKSTIRGGFDAGASRKTVRVW